jgi:hypothetical protein
MMQVTAFNANENQASNSQYMFIQSEVEGIQIMEEKTLH